MDFISSLHSNSPLLGFSMSLIFSLAFTFGVQFLAYKLGVMSKVDFRRKNKKRTALLGGLAIYFAMLISNLFIQNPIMFALLASALPVVIVGALDDKLELSHKPKFISQILAATLFVNLIPESHLIFFSYGAPPIISYILTYFWVITLCNAVNFIDGIDGQATGTSLVIVSALSFLAPNLDVSTAMVTGALIGFLFFNFPPAKIYLGEVGSSTLGFLLAGLTLMLPKTNTPMLSILGVLFIFSYPLIDLSYATIRRTLKKQSPFKGDHDHIHHKLGKIGLNKTLVLATTLGIVIITNVVGFVVFKSSSTLLGTLVTLSSAASLLILLGSFVYAEHRLGTQISHYGKSLLEKHVLATTRLNNYSLVKSGLVIDLLPYYKELQFMGFPTVNSFVGDLASLINNIKTDTDVIILGSYSISVSFYSPTDEDEKLILSFEQLIKKYNVKRSSSRVPEGIFLYRGQQVKFFVKLLRRNVQREHSTQKVS